jgi:hypothetical protein
VSGVRLATHKFPQPEGGTIRCVLLRHERGEISVQIEQSLDSAGTTISRGIDSAASPAGDVIQEIDGV